MLSNHLFSSNLTLATPSTTRNIYPNPTADQSNITSRHRDYELMFQYYANKAFEEVSKWNHYKLRYNLYQHTRSLFNPVTRIIDFYAENIYAGTLSKDSILPDGTLSAIPFSHDTDPKIVEAIDQIWKWSNWQTLQSIMVTYGALTGNCLVEVVDDPERGKIRYKVIHPTHVKVVVLDDFGNVKAFVIEYDVFDRTTNLKYRYGKEVQEGFIRYYRDGQPYNYGRGSIVANPYPFVPAVWIKHLDMGGVQGISAIKSSLGKFDEINSIVSHTADHIHKQINSPRILWTNGSVKNLFNQEEELEETDSRNQQMLLKGQLGGTTDTLVGNLDPQTIIPVIEKMLEEIKSDYPEITIYDKLRDQNIVTSPGAKILMGDVQRKMARPAANYDNGSVKLFQMGVAVGGWRANNGDWLQNEQVELSPQQKKFLPFDFLSYNKGELEMTILARPLVQTSSNDAADEMVKRANAVSAVSGDVPLSFKYKMLGVRQDEIPNMVAEKQKEDQAKAKVASDLAKASKPVANPDMNQN